MLLFDESQTGFYRKKKRWEIAKAISFLLISAVLLFFSYFAILAGVWPMAAILYGPAMIWTFYIGYSFYRRAKSTGPIRVFEKGLALERPVWFMKREERDFMPFENLEAVYVNGCFAYKPKGESRAPWFQFNALFDKEAFLKSLEGRVAIETDAHIGWESRITWRVPDKIDADELHIDLTWGEKTKRLMFDDISRFMEWKRVVIFTMRNGDIFQVEMKRKMYYQFCKSWNEYVNRFWEDPEAEVERWKRLEDPDSHVGEQ